MLDNWAAVRLLIFFFFSSRRRHTRCSRDWSSDVCSSDLLARVFGRSIVWLLSTERNVLELHLALDWRVRFFTVSIAVTTCLVFGLVPAFRSSRAEPGDALKSGSRGVTIGLEHFSFQRFLVVSQ